QHKGRVDSGITLVRYAWRSPALRKPPAFFVEFVRFHQVTNLGVHLPPAFMDCAGDTKGLLVRADYRFALLKCLTSRLLQILLSVREDRRNDLQSSLKTAVEREIGILFGAGSMLLHDFTVQGQIRWLLGGESERPTR